MGLGAAVGRGVAVGVGAELGVLAGTLGAIVGASVEGGAATVGAASLANGLAEPVGSAVVATAAELGGDAASEPSGTTGDGVVRGAPQAARTRQTASSFERRRRGTAQTTCGLTSAMNRSSVSSSNGGIVWNRTVVNPSAV